MKVLHFGNVAMNGYNNAKLLRRLGIDADAICDEVHLLSQPEWEESDVSGTYDALLPPGPSVNLGSWKRPDWVRAAHAPRRRPRGYYRLDYGRSLLRALPHIRSLHAALQLDYAPLRADLGPLTLRDVVAAFRATWMHGLLLGPLHTLFGSYGLVQAYATHSVPTLVAAPRRPYVAYEHGTMRELPFTDTWQGRMLSVSYRRAGKVIITNADVRDAAERLRLENTVFVPHPVDETKYSPGESRLGAELRAQGYDPILLAPARHDWREKANDTMIRAFARVVMDRPRALLILTAWGVDVPRTKTLAAELGVAGNVRWFPPLPKRQLTDAYRGADVVLDQFVFGTFGGIAPEAMACGRPVVLAFDPELHRWCFPELPPVVAARTEAEIAGTLERLASDSAERNRIGAAARAWIERHHGWRLVAERQKAVYEELLARPANATA